MEAVFMRGRVEICGINTAKLPVLRHEENMALLRRVKQGDQQARQELICGNLRLVLAAARPRSASATCRR